jgi:hypothetical protein
VSEAAGQAATERVLRGIPRWLLRTYLEDLGGTAEGVYGVTEEDALNGDGWTATLVQIEDYRIGSLSSGQVRMRVTGQPASVEALLKALEPRLFRGGG